MKIFKHLFLVFLLFPVLLFSQEQNDLSAWEDALERLKTEQTIYKASQYTAWTLTFTGFLLIALDQIPDGLMTEEYRESPLVPDGDMQFGPLTWTGITLSTAGFGACITIPILSKDLDNKIITLENKIKRRKLSQKEQDQ